LIHAAPIGTGGYRQVCLSNGSKQRRCFRIHTLVALAFLGPRPLRAEINHKDSNKTNDSIENLEYISKASNMRHASENGHMHQQISNDDVRMMRASHRTDAELARMFGVRRQSVNAIRQRRERIHVK
jgi:hypothetical protein